MADFLTALSTTTVKRSKDPKPVIEAASTARTGEDQREVVDLDSPEDILKVLKSQPYLETVGRILNHLADGIDRRDGFNLVTPGPVSASIVDTLVTSTIPDYWRIWKEGAGHLRQLVRCLQSANGLGAILGRLRPLIADCRQKKPAENTRDSSVHIEDLIDVLEHVLRGDNPTSQIWNDIRNHAQNPIQKKLMWKEYVAQVGSGRILSIVAEAEDVLKERVSSRKASRLANGKEYASWLGRNIAVLMREIPTSEPDFAVQEICARALGLGYIGMYSGRTLDSITDPSRCHRRFYCRFDA